ncbi:MAG: ATP-dependent DNA helicase [Cyanobacteria bacterium P01_D01_bin.73]
MIETDVHQQLRAFLRSQGELPWLHHLTMARLVARSLRVKRTAIIQVGSAAGTGRHRLSYLTPVLMSEEPIVVVATAEVQQRLIRVEIPRLRQWISDRPAATPMPTDSSNSHPISQRPIVQCPRWEDLYKLSAFKPTSDSPSPLVLISPTLWLQSHLSDTESPLSGITTIIDGADDLEDWARQLLTLELHPSDWQELMLAYPDSAETIRDTHVALTHRVLKHPPSPYECWTLDSQERQWIQELLENLNQVGKLGDRALPSWQQLSQTLTTPDHPILVHLDRRMGQFHLSCTPLHLADRLAPFWKNQTTLFIGSCLDGDAQASIFQQRVGLDQLQNLDIADDATNSIPRQEQCNGSPTASKSVAPDMPHPTLTCLKFSPDRRQESIRLYLPDRLPLPNTPQYQQALLHHIHQLLERSHLPCPPLNEDVDETNAAGVTVILVSDLPLKNQLATQLAANFGSRVRVEETGLDDNGILVCTWGFWRQHQQSLPVPKLLVMAALPIPSLEDPRVASYVAYYKQQRQDWFRLYLLPTALSELQRAIAPIRQSAAQPNAPDSLVALLDSRVVHRSYGRQVLAALSPLARINYLEDWPLST